MAHRVEPAAQMPVRKQSRVLTASGVEELPEVHRSMELSQPRHGIGANSSEPE